MSIMPDAKDQIIHVKRDPLTKIAELDKRSLSLLKTKLKLNFFSIFFFFIFVYSTFTN